MKADELMIGDWVYGLVDKESSKFPTKVTKIDEFGDINTESPYPIEDGEYNGEWEWFDIEPIPITPEILEKNGFDKVQAGWVWLNGKRKVYIQYSEKMMSIEIRNEIAKKDEMGRADLVSFLRDWTDCFYVHELQHALRLCGINKEIIV